MYTLFLKTAAEPVSALCGTEIEIDAPEESHQGSNLFSIHSFVFTMTCLVFQTLIIFSLLVQ